MLSGADRALLMKVHEAYQGKLKVTFGFHQDTLWSWSSVMLHSSDVRWRCTPNIRLVGKCSSMHNTQHMHGTQCPPPPTGCANLFFSLNVTGRDLSLSPSLSVSLWFSLSLTLPLYLSVPFCHIEFSVSHSSQVALPRSLPWMFSAWVQDRNNRTKHFTFLAHSGF